MALFDRHDSDKEHFAGGADLGTRALSTTPVESAFVEAVYDNIAWFYDVAFGKLLNPGRLDAIHRMNIQAGNRILEVGVGTGMNVPLYPQHAIVTGIDLSDSMLERAYERINRHDVTNVRLLRMDAGAMTFPDDFFDVVYAPYLINVVPHPLKVAGEMWRVCKPGGRIIFLNHFRSVNPVMSRIEQLYSRFSVHLGFKADFDLAAFLTQTGLQPISIEKVNVPRIWRLVICEKKEAPGN
jgi:phosphatidylethanolamine/phosphatidyl-N-methylethanolamine N-methyltransferase